MKTPDYSNLKNKTIFDFTDDEELIKKVTGRDYSLDRYLYFVHYVNRMCDVITLAQLTGNKELENKACKTNKIIVKEWRDEAIRAYREHGLIID